MKHRIHLIVLLALVFAPLVRAQSIRRDLAEISKAVEAERIKLHIPGLSLSIIRDDRIILSTGLGLRDVQKNLPVTPETLFAIGSCTKAFTAMSAAMSADDGKLSLDDS